MKIHEYQGKELLRKYGVTVPRGVFCASVDEAVKAAETLTRVLPPEQGPDAAAPSLQRISAFTEVKTVWHPKSMV